jgi:hypothetical protein
MVTQICTKRLDSSESVLLILLLLLLGDRGAFIRIDYLAHLLLVLALASMFVTCASLPRAGAVGLPVLRTLAVATRPV